MGNKSPVIELNGKHFDANSGHAVSAPAHKKHAPVLQQPAGMHLDGFSARPKSSTSHHKRVAAHQAHQKTDRSHTLMRTAVKKPELHTQKAVTTAAIPGAQIVHTREDLTRLKRAGEIKKSPKISKFGSKNSVIQKLAHALPVKEAPSHDEAAAAVHIYSKSRTEMKNPFDDALHHATAHNQPKLKKTPLRHKAAHKLRISPSAFNIGSGVAAVFILVGFFAYQNVPNLSMRVAAAKAGVNASLPGYQPSGFSLIGPIQAQPGKVSIKFKSNSDSREFQVNQQATQWNNESLIENYVAVDRRAYQTYQDNNKTIYIYDNNNATWIDNGVWYQVEGDSNLSADQLLRLASSL